MRVHGLTLLIGVLLLPGCSDNSSGSHEDTAHKDSIYLPVSKDTIHATATASLVNKWIVVKDFYDDTVVLKRLDTSFHETCDYIVFGKDHSLHYGEWNPRPRCGNGIYSLDESASRWEMDSVKNKLILTLYGDVSMSYSFRQKYGYRITSSRNDTMILAREKIYYDNRKELFGKEFAPYKHK